MPNIPRALSVRVQGFIEQAFSTRWQSDAVAKRAYLYRILPAMPLITSLYATGEVVDAGRYRGALLLRFHTCLHMISPATGNTHGADDTLPQWLISSSIYISVGKASGWADFHRQRLLAAHVYSFNDSAQYAASESASRLVIPPQQKNVNIAARKRWHRASHFSLPFWHRYHASFCDATDYEDDVERFRRAARFAVHVIPGSFTGFTAISLSKPGALFVSMRQEIFTTRAAEMWWLADIL